MLLLCQGKTQVTRTQLELSTSQNDFRILDFIRGENTKKSPTATNGNNFFFFH